MDNNIELREFALSKGASCFGVSSFDSREEEHSLPTDTLKDLTRAVSIAIRLSSGILQGITDKPTRLYFHHYRTANMFLDQLTLSIQQFIHNKGFNAFPIPASQIVDWEKQTAHLSHKRFAALSGIGWIGRNNLIVTPEYGARIRLATILTDMPLKCDEPIKRDCGECMECVSVCPANSIKKSKDNFDYMSCYEKLKEFRKKRYVDQFICGICVRACKGEKICAG